MARVWEDLPKIRWSLPLHSDLEEPDDEEIAAAIDADDEEPEDVGRARVTFFPAEPNPEPAAEEQFRLASRRTGIPHDPFLEDELARQSPSRRSADSGEELHDEEAASDAGTHRERLRAALTHDSRRNRAPQVYTTQHDRLQLRVESLMERTRYHLSRSELPEAQRAAELAHKLVENSELEFAPDDERPIDLLTKIAERLRPKTEEPSSESQLALKPPKAEEENQPAAEPAAEEPAPDAAQPTADFDPYAQHVAMQAPKFQRRTTPDTPPCVVLEQPSFEDPAVNPTAYTSSDEAPVKRLLVPRRATSREDESETIAVPPELDPETLAVPPASIHQTSKEASAKRHAGPKLSVMDEDDIAFEDEEDEPAAETVRTAGLWPRWLPLSLLSTLITAFCVWFWRRRVAAARL